jgi:hypothetical protein
MRIIPEFRDVSDFFLFFDLFQFDIYVKGASSAPARASPDLLPVPW